MGKTANYGLPKWEKSDFIKMDDFNGAFANIDAALKANADAAAGAAGAESVSALARDVGTGGKNCRVALGSYTGTGKYGSANPNTLTFPIKPVLVVITSPDSVARHVRPVASGASGGGGVSPASENLAYPARVDAVARSHRDAAQPLVLFTNRDRDFCALRPCCKSGDIVHILLARAALRDHILRHNGNGDVSVAEKAYSGVNKSLKLHFRG